MMGSIYEIARFHSNRGGVVFMIEPIRSMQNPQVKQWASLSSKKGRERLGLYLLEGVHLVAEAVMSGVEVRSIIYVPGDAAVEQLHRLLQEQNPFMPDDQWFAVSREIMEKISDTATPQGIAAIIPIRHVSIETISDLKGNLFVAMEAVQDPGNVGTIIRSADAAGAAAVFIGAGCADLYHPKTIRAAMGSTFHLPVIPCDLPSALTALQNERIRCIATSPNAKQSGYKMDLSVGICLIVGNEGSGVSREILTLCDESVMIPMEGKAESLNVAAATSILLFEALRQRKLVKG
jgi:TrmH family RNA methyltransferase